MRNNKRPRDYTEISFGIVRYFYWSIEEVIRGVKDGKVPLKACLPGIIIALLLLNRIDVLVITNIFHKYHLPLAIRNLLTYAALFSGWVIWGLRRVRSRMKLLKKLRHAFEAANLRCNGLFPKLIEDVAVDHRVRKLRLKTNGNTKSKFEAGTEQIESILNMSVVRVVQNDDKSKIELIYTMKDLDHNIVLENPDEYIDGEIPIGVTFEGNMHVNMRDVGHILVAGQTGGGKSNFLKVVTTILARNNPNSKIVFLDFKGGMESADLKNHAQNLGSHIHCHEGTRDCIVELERIGTDLEDRLKTLAKFGASTFDDYVKKKDARVDVDTETRTSDEKRTYILIDEVAQLYAREPGLDKAKVTSARAAINRIARQGRAAGIHLIVATQKPDASNFDQTVKSNLPAILCFPMPNQASSVSAIGTKRAFEINPNIKGRAVWKFGPKVEEIQTYYFGDSN